MTCASGTDRADDEVADRAATLAAGRAAQAPHRSSRPPGSACCPPVRRRRRPRPRRRSSPSPCSCPASATSARSSSRRTAPSCSTSSPRRGPTARSTRSRRRSRTARSAARTRSPTSRRTRARPRPWSASTATTSRRRPACRPASSMQAGALDTRAGTAADEPRHLARTARSRSSRVAFDGTWRGTDQRRQLDLNAAPVAGHTTLYTSAWGPATPPESARRRGRDRLVSARSSPTVC